jgi:hypothetical protein
VCEHEALNPHKARARSERNRKRARIGASEYVDAER